MNRLKKISLWSAGFLGTLLALYLTTLLLLPRFIDSEAVKKEIRSQFSQMVGGRINFARLELVIWPFPHIAIDQVHITIPPTLSSTVKSSKIYPKILPLLTGDVQIAVVRFESPVLNLKLMAGVKIAIPDLALELEDVSGEIAFSRGFLQGWIGTLRIDAGYDSESD